jgi:hypothetical protein
MVGCAPPSSGLRLKIVMASLGINSVWVKHVGTLRGVEISVPGAVDVNSGMNCNEG